MSRHTQQTETVHPQIKNTYFVVLPEVLFIYLDCFGERYQQYKCLPSLEDKGIRSHWDTLTEERLVHSER